MTYSVSNIVGVQQLEYRWDSSRRIFVLCNVKWGGNGILQHHSILDEFTKI